MAEALVHAQPAACVSPLPEVHFTYGWQDAVSADGGEALLIKTLRRFQGMASTPSRTTSAGRLSGVGGRVEKAAVRGQIVGDLRIHGGSMDQNRRK